MEFVSRGYLTPEELDRLQSIPLGERISKGPVAVIECPQPIPCNPCETACAQRAIKVGIPITSLPMLDWDSCTGCGACVPRCPGQAIFIVDGAKNLVGIPYEFVPLPQAGDEVLCLDRSGCVQCTGQVARVRTGKQQDHTSVVFVSVPKSLLMTVRGIRVVERRV